MRQRHIKWICNAKTPKVEDGQMSVTEHDVRGKPIKARVLPFKHSMMLPTFKGVDLRFGIQGLINPLVFVAVDEHQRNKTFTNVFSVGVCTAIPPEEATPIPCGTAKTGYMIESMVNATSHNIRELMDGKEPTHNATWNTVCLADFGDTGACFVALPKIPLRNVSWFAEDKWGHLAKVAFDKYAVRKMEPGTSAPICEESLRKFIGINRLRDKAGK